MFQISIAQRHPVFSPGAKITSNMPNPDLLIQPMSREDFLDILDEHASFWDDDSTLRLHHPLFIEEFGDTAFIIRAGQTIVAYLLGLYSQTAPIAYVHMVAVRKGHRGNGHARALYDHFTGVAKGKGCTKLKATADARNEKSIRFHLALGMHMQGQPANEAAFKGVKVIRHYLRRNAHRVVFLKDITD